MTHVQLSKVSKTYKLGAVAVPALTNVNVDIEGDRFTVLSGPSGSGKTTLLNIIGGIDRPDAGRVLVAGQDLSALKDDVLADFRSRHAGFIFQNFNLLQVLTAYENVEYPLLMNKVAAPERRKRVLELLDDVGLADRAHHRPNQLSGGQRQRVAIARALAMRPKIVLADEPTANLDTSTGDAIIALMRRMQRERELCVIFSSHDPKVLAEADDVICINDGRVVSIERRNSKVPA